MKWMEIKVRFEARHPQMAAELIAHEFQELGAGGVIFEDPDLESDEPWAEAKARRPLRPAVIGYLPMTHRYAARLGDLQQRLKRLRTVPGISTRLSFRTQDEADWAQAWKAFFKPIRIGENIIIKPSWESVAAAANEQVIEIDPGMAFGTGAHATTALCIELLRSYLKAGDHVLDVGVGSGILTVVAAKLGAGRVVGVDNDETALGVARENLGRNRVPESRSLLLCGHLVDAVAGRFDLVVANLFSDVVIALLDPIQRVLKSGAVLIFSGISVDHQQRVTAALKDRTLQVTAVRKRDEWVALVVRGHRSQ
jgi:ribosomal protein L11 methyltransferase